MLEAGEHIIVVRRGETQLFRSLLERFSRGPYAARVIWDRRMRDRRVIIRDDVEPNRRQTDRRAEPPPSWETHGFIVTQPHRETHLDLRSLGVSETGPENAEPARSAGVSPHDCRRGLRTDDQHLRLYARQLREGGRQVPTEWPLARFRQGFRGSAA
jgi:hypothetical protein